MKYNYTFSENDYKTPPVLYKMALEKFGIEQFTCDVCCTDFNIPAEIYFTKNGTFSQAGELVSTQNGLTGDWRGYAWCNPPFNECKKWVEKADYENKTRGVNVALLLPVRTETEYWHSTILHNPRVEICWLRKGYRFLDKNNQEMGIFKNALALVYFNGEDEIE